MKIKILVLLLILSLLCACSAPSQSDESTSNPDTTQDGGSADPSGDAGSSDSTTNTGASDSSGSTTDTTDSTGGTTDSNSGSENSGSSVSSETSNIIYEKYLAALSMYTLVSEYPDFELDTVYAASFVLMGQKMDSKGIYLSFVSGGQPMFAHLYPVESERKESGARTAYCPELGYAAFDIVESIPEGLSTLQISDYSEYLENISMPTVTYN